MKTLKFALIAALIACTLVSLANTDGFKSKPAPFKVVKIMPLEKAIQIPSLVAAMNAQLDRNSFLTGGALHTYIAEVVCKGTLYRIIGTREEWIKFFRIKGTEPNHIKPVMMETD
jgi:hypothetical protein